MLSPGLAVLLQAIFTCLLIECGRLLAQRLFITQTSSSFKRSLVNEFVCCLQICIMGFEKGLIRAEYGALAWYFSIFATVMLSSFVFRDQVLASPSSAFDEFYRGRRSLRSAWAIIGVHCVAAYVAYRYILLAWRVGLCDLHAKQLVALASCRSLIRVGWLEAVGVEAILTCLCMLAIRAGPRNRIYVAVVVALLTFSGTESTGAFFNPALALSLTYGCEGLEHSDFFAVYWLGPAVGVIVANFLHPYLDDAVRRLKIRTE